MSHVEESTTPDPGECWESEIASWGGRLRQADDRIRAVEDDLEFYGRERAVAERELARLRLRCAEGRS